MHETLKMCQQKYFHFVGIGCAQEGIEKHVRQKENANCSVVTGGKSCGEISSRFIVSVFLETWKDEDVKKVGKS